MSQLPSQGTHLGKITGQLIVNTAKTGSLCVTIPCAVEGDVPWQGKHTYTIINKDGAPMTRSIDNLKELFEWDGSDPFWLCDQDFTGKEVDLVFVHENYQPPVGEDGEAREPILVAKVKYMNPIGGRGPDLPQMADRKSIMAKFGSKFRALATTASKKAVATAVAAPDQAELPAAAPEPEKPKEATSKKSAAAPPAKKSGPPAASIKPVIAATMEEAWEALVKAKPDLGEAEAGEMFYAEIEKAFPGKTNSDLNAQQWGQLKVVFESL